MTTTDDARFALSESIEIAASPLEVYALVSDVTRTGEWSPICRECWWDEGDGPRVGAHFTGRNHDLGRTWETHSTIVAADPGRAFAWDVNGGLVRWGYLLEPSASGTRLTEWWDFTEDARAYFHDKYGDGAQAEIDNRVAAAHEGVPATLAAIKRIVESG